MNILVLNVGSSTVKFQLVQTDAEAMAANADRRLARGQLERIGGEAVYSFAGADGEPLDHGVAPRVDHRELPPVVERHVEEPLVARQREVVGRAADLGAPEHALRRGAHRDHVLRVEPADVEHVAGARGDHEAHDGTVELRAL